MAVRNDPGAKTLTIDPGKMLIRSVITTADADRSGGVVNPLGLRNAEEYLLNPVVLWAHDRQRVPPIGACEWLDMQPRRVVAETRFAQDVRFAEDVFRLYEQGVLRGWSIGFLPRKTAPLAKGIKIDQWDLLEYSAVPIPENPGALTVALQKGFVRDESLREILRRIPDDRGGRIVPVNVFANLVHVGAFSPLWGRGLGEGVLGPSATCTSPFFPRRDFALQGIVFCDAKPPLTLPSPPAKPGGEETEGGCHEHRNDDDARSGGQVPVPRGPGGVHRARDRRGPGKAMPYHSAKVDRRVPWATSGPVGRDSSGYSVLKAAAFALGFVGPEQAKEEIQTHHQLHDLYARYGFLPHHGHQSFFVPLATAHLPVFEPQGRRLRDEVHQKMTAHAGKYDPEEADWLGRRTGFRAKSLGTTTDTAGGTLVSLPMLGELIDLQRNLEAFANAGAREIALPPNGRIQFPRLTGGSTAYWVGEGSPITESQPSTGNLDLQAKKLGIFVKLNNELLRFTSPSAEGLVRYDMARSAALKADAAMLDGTGGLQIKGLTTYSGIGSITASDPGADGDTFEPEDVARMESTLPDAVDAPTAWLMRKQMFAALMNRRADAVTAGDGKGDFLFRAMPASGSTPQTELYGYRAVRTAQIAANRVKGSGTNLTYILLGYFPDWIVARLGVMEFLASGAGDTALQNDQTYLRGIQHIDAGPRNPASFVLCDQLLIA